MKHGITYNNEDEKQIQNVENTKICYFYLFIENSSESLNIRIRKKKIMIAMQLNS